MGTIQELNLSMKIALIQDSLLIKGGSERIFQYLVEEFSEADVFTLAYNPDKAWPEFRNHTIKTSWANRIVQTHSRFKIFFPVATQIFKNWDFTEYDIILSSSATVAKYISKFNGTHVCYCYFPTRAIWNSEKYFKKISFKSAVFRALLPVFKRIDSAAANRVDHFIGISEYTRRAIKDIYKREADVLYCPIEYNRFAEGMRFRKEDHYLIVSRLEPWKCLDYAIEAFNCSGRALRIIGTGEQGDELKAKARGNIKFLGSVDDDTLVEEYGKARAIIFTPILEYGLVPLEANAAGTPVIAIGQGGVTETMIPVNGLGPDSVHPTSIFYNELTPEALNGAIDDFESIHFDRKRLTMYAEKFSIPIFKQSIRKYVEDLMRIKYESAQDG